MMKWAWLPGQTISIGGKGSNERGGGIARRGCRRRGQFSDPISGIGDAAYWNEAGALSAVKGDRMCDISVVIPGAAKIRGAALAEKLGAICNQLFTLP
jgi:hypothetical protein